MSFITVHSLRSLPMHNLNRDQNGLPKSQFDGGIQRGRLSSQSLKRTARIAFREAVQELDGASGSIRTMDKQAATEVVRRAGEIATEQRISFDPAVARKSATSVIKSLAKAAKASADDDSTGTEGTIPAEKKDNILLFSEAELDTLAAALVSGQSDGDEPTMNDFIRDFSSPSLDVAAFGRMFANRSDLSTHAAVAVSHAVMTHQMSLTIDYFTAVDELADEERTDAGAGHLGLAYYTSGVYYSTFTIDPAQLKRSWSGFGSATARSQVEALVKALVEALPTGKLTNTNAHTTPFLVLVEHQKGRNVYEFETPVQPGRDGGYREPTVASLIDQYNIARTYDSKNYLETVVFAPGLTDEFVGADAATSISELSGRVATQVFGEAR